MPWFSSLENETVIIVHISKGCCENQVESIHFKLLVECLAYLKCIIKYLLLNKYRIQRTERAVGIMFKNLLVPDCLGLNPNFSI